MMRCPSCAGRLGDCEHRCRSCEGYGIRREGLNSTGAVGICPVCFGTQLDPYWTDGERSIYHADCRDILPLVQAKVDLVLTDPPYGISYESGHDGVLARSIQGDDSTALRDWLLTEWIGPALVFGTWKVPPPAAARQILIWDTLGALGMGALDLPWKPSHQQIYVIGKGFSGYRSNDVLSFPPCQSSAYRGRQHPLEKPIALIKDLLGKCPGDIILDPFLGSGTTLRAAKDLGRRGLGIELELDYCKTAADRMAQAALPLAEPERVEQAALL